MPGRNPAEQRFHAGMLARRGVVNTYSAAKITLKALLMNVQCSKPCLNSFISLYALYESERKTFI